MKSKRDLIKTIAIIPGNLSHIENTGVINGTLLLEIERVMEEYARQSQSDASSEEIRKWGKGCTNCGIKELITDGYCNCCGAVQMSFLK